MPQVAGGTTLPLLLNNIGHRKQAWNSLPSTSGSLEGCGVLKCVYAQVASLVCRPKHATGPRLHQQDALLATAQYDGEGSPWERTQWGGSQAQASGGEVMAVSGGGIFSRGHTEESYWPQCSTARASGRRWTSGRRCAWVSWAAFFSEVQLHSRCQQGWRAVYWVPCLVLCILW